MTTTPYVASIKGFLKNVTALMLASRLCFTQNTRVNMTGVYT